LFPIIKWLQSQGQQLLQQLLQAVRFSCLNLVKKVQPKEKEKKLPIPAEDLNKIEGAGLSKNGKLLISAEKDAKPKGNLSVLNLGDGDVYIIQKKDNRILYLNQEKHDLLKRNEGGIDDSGRQSNSIKHSSKHKKL